MASSETTNQSVTLKRAWASAGIERSSDSTVLMQNRIWDVHSLDDGTTLVSGSSNDAVIRLDRAGKYQSEIDDLKGVKFIDSGIDDSTIASSRIAVALSLIHISEPTRPY